MHLKKLNPLTIAITVLALTAIAFGIYQYNHARSLEQQISKQKHAFDSQLVSKDEEIRYLLFDTAKLQESKDVPYSFQEFGVFSSLFRDKTIKEEKYLYRRTQIKKMTITIHKPTTGSNVPSADDSNYYVEIWEYPSLLKTSATLPEIDVPKVAPNYNGVFVNAGSVNNSMIKVAPLNQIRLTWSDKNIYTNKYSIKFQSVPFSNSSIYIDSFEIDLGPFPNIPYRFMKIRPAANLYYTGEYGYDSRTSDFLNQVTKNLKEIADTITLRPEWGK